MMPPGSRALLADGFLSPVAVFGQAFLDCFALVPVHPWHNMFLSVAHREADIREALEITDIAFGKVKQEFGAAA